MSLNDVIVIPNIDQNGFNVSTNYTHQHRSAGHSTVRT